MHLLTERMAALEKALSQLCECLLSANLVQAEVYKMPFVTKEQEDEMRASGATFEHCPVQLLTKNEALTESVKAFSHMYVLDEALSTYYVHKWPGVLVFDSHHADIKQAITEVNNAKLAFKLEVQALGDRDEKFEVVHRLFHRLVTFAAFRQVHSYDDVTACYFSWQRRAKSERLTKEDAKRKIVNQRGKLSQLDTLARQRILDTQLSRLSQCGDNTLRLRKPAQVRPVVSVKTSEKLFGTTCGTPIITFSDKPISITPLPSLCTKRNSDTQLGAWKPVVPHLHIYEKRD